MEGAATAPVPAPPRTSRRDAEAELVARLQEYKEAKRQKAARDGRAPFARGQGACSPNLRPRPGAATPGRPPPPSGGSGRASPPVGGATACRQSTPRAVPSRPSQNKENETPRCRSAFADKRSGGDGKSTPATPAAPFRFGPATRTGDSGKMTPSPPSATPRSVAGVPRVPVAEARKPGADAKRPPASARGPCRSPSTKEVQCRPTSASGTPASARRPPAPAKNAEPRREVVWNDLEEMYSFDLDKVQDMVAKGRQASTDLEEQYSFDLAKVEDLVSKSRSEASGGASEEGSQNVALAGTD